MGTYAVTHPRRRRSGMDDDNALERHQSTFSNRGWSTTNIRFADNTNGSADDVTRTSQIG